MAEEGQWAPLADGVSHPICTEAPQTLETGL